MEALKERRFSYSDYISWPDDERWEIIDGIAYNMSPAPAMPHQNISSQLIFRIMSSMDIAKSKCELFHAPCDVVLGEHDVVQPDILIVCDPKKIGPKNVQGVPDCVFEIKSPSTAVKDRKVKFSLYERYGVQTYIIVHPDVGMMEVFTLVSGSYHPGPVLDRNDTLKLEHPPITVPLDTIFPEPPAVEHKKSPLD